MEEQTASRQAVVHRGMRLQYFTIIYNCLEGFISLVAGLFAGSVSLIGFGFDSLIEVASGAIVLWRLRRDDQFAQRAADDQKTLHVVGWCFIVLAIYIIWDSGTTLMRQEAPERSIPGIILAAVSIVVMPLLAAAKRRVAAEIGSAAVKADSRQTDFCTYLSAVLLCGLGLNALFGWWWADPVAALIMTPIIAKEGIRSLKGKQCCDSCAMEGLK
jgi:divalent metal cation (Fe/Co/Zn/Cd) transporter